MVLLIMMLSHGWFVSFKGEETMRVKVWSV